MNAITQLEATFAEQIPILIKSLTDEFGIDVEVRHLKPSDKYSKAYGKASNQYDSVSIPTRILLTNYEFAPYNSVHIGQLGEAEAYDLSDTLQEGDLISMSRVDGKTRNYKVMNKVGIGKEMVVMYKFMLASTAED